MSRRVKVAFPLMDGHKSDVDFDLDDLQQTLEELVPEFLEVLKMEGIEPAVQATDDNGMPAFTVVMSRGYKQVPVSPSDLQVPIAQLDDFTALEILPMDGSVGAIRIRPESLQSARKEVQRTPHPPRARESPTAVLRRQAVQRRYEEFLAHAAGLDHFVGDVGRLQPDGEDSAFSFVLCGVTARCENTSGATGEERVTHPMRVVFPRGYPGKGFELFYDVEASRGVVPFHPNIAAVAGDGASAHGAPGWVCLWETVPPDAPVARAVRQFVDMISYRQMNLSDIHPNLNRRAWAAASRGELAEIKDNPYFPWVDEARRTPQRSPGRKRTATLVNPRSGDDR